MTISDALPVQFWSVLTDTYNEKEVDGVFKKCFCAPWNCSDLIKIQFDFGAIDAYYLKLIDTNGSVLHSISFSLTTGTVYTASFSPTTYSLCDDTISLSIYRNSTELYKSDCLHIKSDWNETVLIYYSNNRNFAGLNYSAVSPDPEFSIRIPGVFFEERFPEEDEVLELSNSRSIQLNAQVKAQRFLKVGSMPDYMHRKLKLILKHQFVEIDNQDWVKGGEDAYELLQMGKNSLRQARVWLTEKDYILRNVL